LNLRPPRPERGALPDCADSDKRRRLYDRPPGLQAPAVSHYLLFAGPLPRIGEHPGATIVLIEEFTPAAQSLRHENGRAVHWLKSYFLLACRGLRNRTPSPPVPLSSMSSMPAVSKACRIAASLASVTGISPSTTSTRRIVATPTLDAAAKSRAVHRSIARAARI
jgi:hypothetical protein